MSILNDENLLYAIDQGAQVPREFLGGEAPAAAIILGSGLKPGGGFACELHVTCLDEAAAIAEEAGFTAIRVVDDLAGRPRVLIDRKPAER